MMTAGVSTYEHHGFTRVPYFDLIVGSPHDLMHMMLEGCTRSELAAVVYCICRQLNVPWSTMKATILSAHKYGITVPALNTDQMYHGDSNGNPHSDCAFPGTAAQVLDFALISVALFEPFFAGKEENPVWVAWKLHVEILTLLLFSSYTVADVVYLDKLIFTWQSLFLDIEKYCYLWKPKHHFVSHFPQHIIDWGPPRLYWCMRFEAENQLIKALAVACNMKSMLYTVTNGMALRTARNIFLKVGAGRLSEPELIRPVVEVVHPGSSAIIDRMRADGVVVPIGPLSVTWAAALEIGRYNLNSRSYVLIRKGQGKWHIARVLSIFQLADRVYIELHIFSAPLREIGIASWEVQASELYTPTRSSYIRACHSSVELLMVRTALVRKAEGLAIHLMRQM
jgi:hypothetical protein